MDKPNVSAELKTNISVSPERSQVLLVAFAVVLIVCLVCGTILLGADKQIEGYALLVVALVIFFGTLWSWNQSQSDSDLAAGYPTQIALPDGTSLSTDTRVLKSPLGIQSLIQVLHEATSRKPLPNPSALFDEKSGIIPNSSQKAAELVEQLNNDVQVKTNQIFEAFGLHDEEASTLQDFTDCKEPSQADLIQVKKVK